MPKIITKTANLNRDEWLNYRKRGIGGSDAATICGLNDYGSLVSLWCDKTGRGVEKKDNEAMRQGRDLEEYVARRFTEATGKKVRRRNMMFAHDTIDFLIADVDREIVGENAGLECKTTKNFNKTDLENGEIPLYYLCQCRHYMHVMNYDRMYLAVLVFGSGFYWYTIERDKSEEEALVKLEVDYWNKYIIPDICPPADGKDATTEALKNIKSDKDGEKQMLTDDNIAEQYKEIGDKISELKVQQEQLKQQLIINLDGFSKGFTQRYNISYGSSERSSVDSKLLKSKYPEIYKEVIKTSDVRTFRLTERK